jgi:hypothetical protein
MKGSANSEADGKVTPSRKEHTIRIQWINPSVHKMAFEIPLIADVGFPVNNSQEGDYQYSAHGEKRHRMIL